MCSPGDIQCPADCNRDYTDQLDTCPCKSGCPQGCPCPDYDCMISTTGAPDTTRTPFECADYPAAAECTDQCVSEQSDCLSSCGSDSSCQYACTNTMLRCVDNCPCYANCPQGCSNCDSDYCVCNDKQNYPEFISCEKVANSNYSICISKCDHGEINACVAACNNSYNDEIEKCPCGAQCPNGCPCPEYDCNDTPETQSDTILVFNKYSSSNKPFLTNISGVSDFDIKFEVETFTDVAYACSVSWKNQIYLFGGNKYHTQIRWTRILNRIENNTKFYFLVK